MFLNQLNLLDECVDGDTGRFRELTGELFAPLIALYQVTSPVLTDVPKVTYERKDNLVAFSISCSKADQEEIGNYTKAKRIGSISYGQSSCEVAIPIVKSE